MSESWYKNTLGKEATEKLRAAERAWVSTMATLYPVGSHWLCFHGSNKGYEVEITGHDIHHGIHIVNVKTNKGNHVWWATLQEIK